MAEYDAFGRKIEGSDSTQPAPDPEEIVVPEAEPVAEAAMVVSVGADDTAEPDPVPAPLRLSGISGGSGRGPVAMIVVVSVVITVVGALVASAFVAFNSSDVEKRIRDAVPTIPAVFPEDTETDPQAAPEPAEPAPPPVGLAPRSLIREAAFAKAVARLRRSGIGQLTNLRVAADRINAQLKTAKGELASVQVRYDGEFRRFSTSGPGFDHVPTFPFSAIEKRAPQRLAREASGRRGVSVKRVDYLVMSKFGDEVIWNLFFQDSVHFQGDRSGHVVRRV